MFYPDGRLIVQEQLTFATPIKLTYAAGGAANPHVVIWSEEAEQWKDVPSEAAGDTVSASLATYGRFVKLSQ
ncbi:MAG: hypothetical protein HC884_06140 [Chloroflexaceae bacterium]|nr:hypothetical protein [Chloroflexaceae bacterium]